MTPDESSLGYGDYSGKYQTAGMYEQMPRAGRGQFPALIDAPFNERQAFNAGRPFEKLSLFLGGGVAHDFGSPVWVCYSVVRHSIYPFSSLVASGINHCLVEVCN